MYACFKYACLYLFIWVCDYRSTWLSCMAFRRGLAHSGCVLWDDDLARREARSSGGFRNISWLLTRLLRPLMSSSCRLVSSPLLFSSLLLSFLLSSLLLSSRLLFFFSSLLFYLFVFFPITSVLKPLTLSPLFSSLPLPFSLVLTSCFLSLPLLSSLFCSALSSFSHIFSPLLSHFCSYSLI